MRSTNLSGCRQGWLATLLLAMSVAATSGQTVETLRVPDGGRLPHAVVADDGTVHLVYVAGEGDLMYARLGPNDTELSPPQRVNSAPGTVTGIGPIDGGQLALGPDGRVHVAWMRMRPPAFFYTRSNLDGPGFEEQFGVASGDGIEAGPALAVDGDNTVYLFWHSGGGEDAGRAVYMAASRDGGLIFEPAQQINAPVEGACACCGLTAIADHAGSIYLSYRGARENIHRGQRLLTSSDAGATFADDLLQPWDVGACPVAVPSLTTGPTGTTVAWETQGQVQFARADTMDRQIVEPTGTATLRRKNPTVAVNHRGETLLAWGDGSGFRSGGTLHWQLFDADSTPGAARADDGERVPESSIPAALARPDGSFLVVY